MNKLKKITVVAILLAIVASTIVVPARIDLTGTGGSSCNPFDQNLNTYNSVEFKNIGVNHVTSDSVGCYIDVRNLTGGGQYAIATTGTVTENANFNIINAFSTFSPSGNDKNFMGINLGAQIGGSSDINYVRGFSSPILASSYTGTINHVNIFEAIPYWFSAPSTIHNINAFIYTPLLLTGNFDNQVAFRTSILDEAVNNTHILLSDTQPAGNHTIYSTSVYPSYFAGTMNTTGYNTNVGTGWSGWIDDGVGTNATYSGGIIIAVAGTSGTAGNGII